MVSSLHTYYTSDPPRPDDPGRARADYESAMYEYTNRHREVWPALLRSPEADSLVASEAASWLRLWGGLGQELYQCFRMGDDHIRQDMITRARHQGGWRGAIIANKLDRWRGDLDSTSM